MDKNKNKRTPITRKWDKRTRKINGVNRKVKVRKIKNKVQIKVINDKRKRKKPQEKIKYSAAKEEFEKRSIRSKLLDRAKNAKKIFKSEDRVPKKYIKKGGTSKYDIEGIDTIPKKEKLPKHLHSKKANVKVNKQNIKGTTYHDSNRLFHTTSFDNFKKIIKEKKIKPKQYHDEGKLISFSVDPAFTYYGSIKMVFNKKKIKDKVKPVKYYDNAVYGNFLEDKKDSIKEKKELYPENFKHEREWQSKKPITVNKDNLKEIVFITDNHKGTKAEIKKDIKDTRKIAKDLGVKFKITKTGTLRK